MLCPCFKNQSMVNAHWSLEGLVLYMSKCFVDAPAACHMYLTFSFLAIWEITLQYMALKLYAVYLNTHRVSLMSLSRNSPLQAFWHNTIVVIKIFVIKVHRLTLKKGVSRSDGLSVNTWIWRNFVVRFSTLFSCNFTVLVHLHHISKAMIPAVVVYQQKTTTPIIPRFLRLLFGFYWGPKVAETTYCEFFILSFLREVPLVRNISKQNLNP